MTAPERKYTPARIRAAVAMTAALGTIVACGACGPKEELATPHPSSPTAPSQPARSSEPPTPAASTPQRPSKPSSSTPDSNEPPEGWKTVRYGSHLRYDVPPDWEVKKVRSGGVKVPVATYHEGFCKASPKEELGTVILTTNPAISSPKKAVRTELQRSADAFYPDRSHRVKVLDLKYKGDAAASAGKITLAPSKDPCDGDSAVVAVHGWTTPQSKGVNLLVAIGELGLDESPDPGDLVRIANSLRGDD